MLLTNEYVQALDKSSQIVVRHSELESTTNQLCSIAQEFAQLKLTIREIRFGFEGAVEGGPDAEFEVFTHDFMALLDSCEQMLENERGQIMAFHAYMRGQSVASFYAKRIANAVFDQMFGTKSISKENRIDRMYRLANYLRDQGKDINVTDWDEMSSTELFQTEKQLIASMRDATGDEVQRRMIDLILDGPSPNGTPWKLLRDQSPKAIWGAGLNLLYDHNSEVAINTVLANTDMISEMAERYDIPPALLAGTLAAEMDMDFDAADYIQDGLARNGLLDNVAGASTGLLGGPLGYLLFADDVHEKLSEGLGSASVHTDGLENAIEHLNGTSPLPGANYANAYDWSDTNRASFEGSTEAAAIVLAALTDKHGGISSPEDMAVIWGGYYSGVEGFSPPQPEYGYSLDDFKLNKVNGWEAYDNQFSIGASAYMSQPYFEFFQAYYGE